MAEPSRICLALLFTMVALAGCASQPARYSGLASATELKANPQDKGGHLPFLYTANDTNWSKYNAVILEPVSIYTGPDQQFGDTSEEDKKELRTYMQEQFAKSLQNKFAMASVIGPDTMRVRVTLTGVEPSTPVLGTVTKLTPAGVLINTVQTVRDKQATLSGSVSFAVEIYDSTSNRLLRAYVSKQYPLAENIFASFGTLDAARAGIRRGADNLLGQLRGT